MAPVKQVYVVTGPRASGKSMSVATFPPATKEGIGAMLVVDTEDSMSNILANQERLGLKFGAYIRMYDRFKVGDDMLERIAQGKLPWVGSSQRNALVQYWEYFIGELHKRLESGKFKYVGIDTVEPVEAAMAAWAEANPRLSGWSGTRAYGRLETEGVRPLYENLLEGMFNRGVEHIILTSHLKRVWEEDKPVLNKVQPGGRLNLLARISSMMFWLVREANNDDGAPAAIVLKARACVMDVKDGQWAPRRALPDRIPHFSWADVRRYLEKGCDLKNPARGETLSVDEKDMISEMLTDEQMKLMVMSQERDLEIAKAARQVETVQPVVTVEPDVEEVILELSKGDLNPMQIAEQAGVSLPDVIRVLGKRGG